MSTSRVQAGLAGCLLIVASVGAHAEDGSGQASCSGFACLFSSHSASQAAPAPAAPATAAAAAPVPASELSPIADLDASSVKKSVKVAPPAVHPVTIAAGATEIVRLKALTAVMPRSSIRFVKSASDDADFKVTATLDDGSSDRKVKLFTEQMHVVASAAVHSIADLKGKVVSFGPADSASRAAAHKVFDALAIPVQETPLDFENAFDGLATGDIDAVVLLAPQPSEMLKNVTGPGLHLVAWPDGGALPSGASATAISGSNYPHLAVAGENIRAVGVDAVLAMSAHGARQPAAKSFYTLLLQRSAALSKRGFDLLKADLEERSNRRLASAERR